MDLMAAPLGDLEGIGPKRLASFRKELGMTDIGQLLRLLPKGYAEPGMVTSITCLPELEGTLVRVRGTVEKTWVRGFGRRAVVCVRMDDGESSCIIPWFNQPYLRNAFPLGRQLWVEGTVSLKQGVQLHSPKLIEESSFHESSPIPLYADVESMSGKFLRRTILLALEKVIPIQDPIPESLREQVGVPSLEEALSKIHRPTKLEETQVGRRRLAWGEVLAREQRRLQSLGVMESASGMRLEERVWDRILERLPFELTKEQKGVLKKLRQDLESGQSMRRLLHGEVGSGKTAVAFALALAVAAEGKQVALLAPTEILARQHLNTFRNWLMGAELQVVGFFGDDDAKTRRKNRQHISSQPGGDARPVLAIGTHALFSDDVQFGNLGLVIFDEQHRFGVRQKAKLVSKGSQPHVLTMTATPIPRTLAWSHYGALEPCELRSRPGTGGEIFTEVHELSYWGKWAAEHFVRLQKGESTFVVAPHIDGANGLLELAKEIQQEWWPEIPVSIVHGRLSGEEIESRVAAFREGKTQVLLGTTVVEVGLDIPAIPWMAVLQAQRFGLASLHQLRGRLARGAEGDKGTCILFSEKGALPRLRQLEECQDGFTVANLDLAQRGPGAFSGTRQHGRNDFQIFRPEQDGDLVEALCTPEVRIWLQNKS